MPSAGEQHLRQQARGGRAIVGTFLLQILVLLALSALTLVYLDWSSGTNLAEFTAAGQTRLMAPARPAKADSFCHRGHRI